MLLFIQLTEVRIAQIFYEVNGFTGTFHFRSQLFANTGEFFKLNTGSLIAYPFRRFTNLPDEFFVSKHPDKNFRKYSSD